MTDQLLIEKCITCGSEDMTSLIHKGDRITRCNGCGIVYRVSQDSKKDYCRDIAEHYSSIDPDSKVAESRERLFEEFFDNLAVENQVPLSILDIGCGKGYFLYLAQKRGWRVLGVELAAGLAAKGKEKYGIDIRSGSFEEVDLVESGFDVITMWNVFDSIPDPLGCLRKVGRILSPGGTFFLRTPNAAFHMFIFKVCRILKCLHLEKALPKQSFLFHRFTFSSGALKLLLEKNGFINVSIKNSPPTSGDPYNVKKGVGLLKVLSYFTAQVIYVVSFRRLIVAPSIEVFAKRA